MAGVAHAYTYVCICTAVRTHVHTCRHVYKQTHTDTQAHVRTHTHHTHAHAHTHILFPFPLQVDNALALVELGIEYQVPGLEVVHHDFQTLHTLVYHCHVDPTLSLPHLRRMSNLEKVQAMMRKVRGNGRNSRHLIIGCSPHWGWGQPQLQPSSSSLVSEWHPMPGRRELSHHKHSMYSSCGNHPLLSAQADGRKSMCSFSLVPLCLLVLYGEVE